MGRAADKACIQYRMLNRGKGPAVHSLRAQADRRKYQQVMKHTLERQEHLTLRQGEVVALRTEDGSVRQVVLRTGAVYGVRAVVLCSGTYLHGRTIVGECVEPPGRMACTPPESWRTVWRLWDCPCGASRPGRPHGSTPERWTLTAWRCRPVTTCRYPSAFPPPGRGEPGGVLAHLYQ